MEQEQSSYSSSSEERIRLGLQNYLLRLYDQHLYEEIFKSLDSPAILDLGCFDGSVVLTRCDEFLESFTFLGLDNNPEVIERMQEKYCDQDNINFEQMDVCVDDFDERLREAMKSHSIEGFDLIHISLLLLHLPQPLDLLKKLRHFLKPDGRIFIKDSDDTQTCVEPDENGEFARIIKMCDHYDFTGNRHFANKIGSLLEEAGYSNVKKRNSFITTDGLDKQHKELFWQFYFRELCYKGIQKMLHKFPEDELYSVEYEWFNDNYVRLFRKFMEEETRAQIGYPIFIANK